MKVTFETATLADALKKADRVAPSRGKAFDESGGIVMELLPDQGLAVLHATDTQTFYREWVSCEIEGAIPGDEVATMKWRLPNMIVTPIILSLPIGTGKTVSFEEKESGLSSYLEIRSGRMKGKCNLMDLSFYPHWEVFDPDDLTPVSDIGGRVSQVEWCASKDTAPLTGVHFTGEFVRATDRYRLANVPLVITNLPGPTTVPAGMLGSILKQTGDVRVGFTDTQMLLMPNDTTQIRVVTYGGDYPTMERLMDRDRPESVSFKKSELLDIVNRATIAAGGDRLPALKMYFGNEEIAVLVQGGETAVLDVMEVPGHCTHKRVEIIFTPKNITEVLNNAPNDSVTLHYDPSLPEKITYLDGGSGYEVWIAARRPSDTA